MKSIKDKKFIIHTGCSYGHLTNSTIYPYFFKDKNHLEVDDDVYSITLSINGSGAEWASDSCISVCQLLLNNGVPSKNIYCLVEWSQIHRMAMNPLTNHNFKKSDLDFNYDSKSFVLNVSDSNDMAIDIQNFIQNELNIGISNKSILLPIINDKIYINPFYENLDNYKNLSENYTEGLEFLKKIEDKFPMEMKIKSYLDFILKTQFYLEKNNIDYNFYFMQSTLSGWQIDPTYNILYNDIPFKSIEMYSNEKNKIIKTNFNPSYQSNTDLEVLCPEFKNQIDLINFDNFWMYESDKFRRGGTDEWTLDNFGKCGYIQLPNIIPTNEFGPISLICSYGCHPSDVANFLVWNSITKNCKFLKVKPEYENQIKNKFWEDYNSNVDTIHGITISEKYRDKLINDFNNQTIK